MSVTCPGASNIAESRAPCRGNKVTEREQGVPSYVSKPRSNVEGAEGQGPIKGEDWVEERMRGPGLRHGASRLSLKYFVSILDNEKDFNEIIYFNKEFKSKIIN